MHPGKLWPPPCCSEKLYARFLGGRETGDIYIYNLYIYMLFVERFGVQELLRKDRKKLIETLLKKDLPVILEVAMCACRKIVGSDTQKLTNAKSQLVKMCTCFVNMHRYNMTISTRKRA